jgi:ADP-heptose:LPS heptosyltransferase
MLVTPDSGGVHLAAACGVPVVGLYATPAKEERWRPWGVPSETIVGDRKVATIPVAEVLEKVDLLRRRLLTEVVESDA